MSSFQCLIGNTTVGKKVLSKFNSVKHLSLSLSHTHTLSLSLSHSLSLTLSLSLSLYIYIYLSLSLSLSYTHTHTYIQVMRAALVLLVPSYSLAHPSRAIDDGSEQG